MTIAGTDRVVSRLSALKADALQAAGRALAVEAEALIAEARAAGVPLTIEEGASPLVKRIVLGGPAPRALEFGTRQKPGRAVLLRVLTAARRALPPQLSAALSGILGKSR
jgi:hypothetical protein